MGSLATGSFDASLSHGAAAAERGIGAYAKCMQNVWQAYGRRNTGRVQRDEEHVPSTRTNNGNRAEITWANVFIGELKLTKYFDLAVSIKRAKTDLKIELKDWLCDVAWECAGRQEL